MIGEFHKLRKVHEQVKTEFYSMIPVEFYFEEQGISADEVKVQIGYNIETIYRTRGLVDILMSFYGKLPIEYTLIDSEGNETERTIEVELSDLKEEWFASNEYTPERMSLHIKKDGSVDYEKSYIDLNYIKKG